MKAPTLPTRKVTSRWFLAALLGTTLPLGALGAADANAPAAVTTNALPAQVTNSAPAALTNAAAPVVTNAAPAAVTNAPAPAATTNAAPEKATKETPPAKPKAEPVPKPEDMFEGGTTVFNNWIVLSVGDFFTSGNRASFQRQEQATFGPFGGIEDLHIQGSPSKGTTVTVDGHSIFDQHDYQLSVGVQKEKLGYVKVSASEFRTWYDGDGGFYSPTDLYYALSPDALTLDRQNISLEAGLTLEHLPKVVFKYSHNARDGEKDSTSWAMAHPAPGVTRGLSPSFYDLHEHSDLFQLDATHHIKATDLGLGLSYETGKLDDSRNIDRFPGELFEQKITDRQGTTYDLFNVHAFTETWLKKNLMLSTGFAYSDLDNNLSGSRIYGNDFGVGYVPTALQTDFGYFDLSGSSRLHEYVVDLNLMYKPLPHLRIIPSIRVQYDDWNANASGSETLMADTPQAFSSDSNSGELDVRERLDLVYNGITNWVFYARGELTEGDGNLYENGGLVQMPIVTPFSTSLVGRLPVQFETDDTLLFQKYSAGARWYPTSRISLDAGGYYKNDHYDYTHNLDSTLNNSFTRYPAYLVMQDFDTTDGNVRLTWRPLNNVSMISRYEFQYSTIDTRPDPLSGLGEVESSKMTSHILAEDITWTPWSRLYLQAGFNYVASKTKTPASDVTQAILEAQNNYWMLNFSSGLVLDDRTDLKLSYFYYLADDYKDISLVGVPYGAGGQEHGITATLTRRISKNLRLLLRYGFFHYNDALYGDNRDFDAHLVYSSLQYRF